MGNVRESEMILLKNYLRSNRFNVNLEMYKKCIQLDGFLVFLWPLHSLLKLAFLQSLSCENKFDLHKNEPAGKTHVNENGFVIFGIKTKRS